MAKMLDRSRAYSESIPPTQSGCAYIQDWIMYDGFGYPLPRDKQEHRDKQAAVAPPALPDDEDWIDPMDRSDAIDMTPVGPIDPDQRFFALKKEVLEQLNINVRTKAEAVRAIRKAGRLP